MDTVTDKELIQEWKQSMENFVIKDVRGALERNFLEVGLIILTMVGIDCISGYFAGKPADVSTFKGFVTSKYFPPSYHNLGDDLYHLRNGLVHDYTSKDKRFAFFRQDGDGYPHLQPINPERPYPIALNREIFAKDYLKAWETYSSDVPKNKDMTTKVLRRVAANGRGFLIVGQIPHVSATSDNQNQISRDYRGGTIPWPKYE